jgi:hypothetical protein
MPQVLDTEGREVQVFDAFAFNGNFEVKATGYKGTATSGTTSNVDFAIGAEERYTNGIKLLLKNHADEDTLGLQIVDKDNVLGYGAGLVLKTFGINWNVDSEKSDQGQNVFNYAAKIPAGVYVRVVYVSTGATDVKIKLNLLLHKKSA